MTLLNSTLLHATGSMIQLILYGRLILLGLVPTLRNGTDASCLWAVLVTPAQR